MIQLFDFQKQGLEETKDLNKVAYYYDMGLGKTFVGSEKMIRLGAKVNLIICQKSKVDDWVQHTSHNYDVSVWDLTEKNGIESFFDDMKYDDNLKIVGIINYELAFRRPELSKLKNFTLMLDESSLIQNEQAKRSKFILKKLHPDNVILLSGTPTGGKYEKLWSQLHLLGWNISKDLFWKQYVDFHYEDNEGFPFLVIDGYKNVDRLKAKMNEYGCKFLKTDEVFELPEQSFIETKVQSTKAYEIFRKKSIVILNGEIELVGDTTLNKMLYERQLCGQYNAHKKKALLDVLASTDERVIVFYNFNDEYDLIEDCCIELDKPVSIINGHEKDLKCYEEYSNSVTIIQYLAGAMGHNLQKSRRIVYFTPPLSSELFEQSKKRIHRIGQNETCFYYELICKDSIEERIYKRLEMRKDYTDKLFEKERS